MAERNDRVEQLQARMANIKARQAEIKATEAAMKAEKVRLRFCMNEAKALIKEEKARAKAERDAAKPKRKPRVKKEAPKAKQEEMKEAPREYENRIAREVANEIVSAYKLTVYSTIEEINIAKRRFNMANHPDTGGNATKCKIGNMYFDAIIKKGFERAMKMAA